MISDLKNMSESSRVWIYQADKELSPHQCMEIKTLLRDFVTNWSAHNKQLMAYGDVFHNRFIVLMADETHAGASGCSIDKATHFIENLGSHYEIDFFDRKLLSYYNNLKQIEIISLEQLSQFLSEGRIHLETLFFNTLVKTKKEWEENWIIPLNQSWIQRFV